MTIHEDHTGDMPPDAAHLTIPLPPEDPLEGVEPTDEPAHWRDLPLLPPPPEDD